MEFKINSWFSPEARVDEWDARAVAIALTRLDYFNPDPKFGLAPFDPDQRLFHALRTFQSEHGLFHSGTVFPGDATDKALQSAVREQEQCGEPYVWRSVGDDKAHAVICDFDPPALPPSSCG